MQHGIRSIRFVCIILLYVHAIALRTVETVNLKIHQNGREPKCSHTHTHDGMTVWKKREREREKSEGEGKAGAPRGGKQLLLQLFLINSRELIALTRWADQLTKHTGRDRTKPFPRGRMWGILLPDILFPWYRKLHCKLDAYPARSCVANSARTGGMKRNDLFMVGNWTVITNETCNYRVRATCSMN